VNVGDPWPDLYEAESEVLTVQMVWPRFRGVERLELMSLSR
jgi:hypothetical protein